MHGGVPNKEFNENNNQCILDSDKELSYILNELESNRALLDDSNNIQYITSLLGIGADPNTKGQDGKTLLHYVAECNNIDAIRFLLSIKADPSITDKSGKTPAKYATESDCIRALSYPDPDKDQGYHSDGSCENEENPANNSSNYPNKHNDDQTLRDDPGYSSDDDNKTISTEPSDCDRKDEDSSCSSSDYLFLEDSLLAKLEIPLTESEERLIDEFCEKMEDVKKENDQESALRLIQRITDKYLREGIRLNSCYGERYRTVTNLVFEEIQGLTSGSNLCIRDSTFICDNSFSQREDQDCNKENVVSKDDTIRNIISDLVSKGGKVERSDFFDGNEFGQIVTCNEFDNDLDEKYKETKSKLKSIAHESIVNKSTQTQDGLEVGIDNRHFCIEYPQDSIIEPAKILNHEKAKELNLKVGILQIGESIVRVESIDGKRNYTDILEGSIEMSFTTEVGEISIYLHPSKEGSNKIEVEIDDESEARLNKLKAEKKSLGENCLLGGKSVLEAIEDKGFKKNGNVPTESIKTIKDDLSTNLTQVRLQQNREVALGG